MKHIAYLDNVHKLCTSCSVQGTKWRVRAGTSTYIVCLNCMGQSEHDCAMEVAHKLCTEER